MTSTTKYLAESDSQKAAVQDGSKWLFFTKPWYSNGHLIQGKTPGVRYMNEHAVRARAGLLNVTAFTGLILLLTLDDPSVLMYTMAPVPLWDMLFASIFGLTPLSPYGILGTLLVFWKEPEWKPANPKRFAWFLGTIMVSMCIVFGSLKLRAGVMTVMIACIVLTWLEACLGFCLGCFMWNSCIAKMLKKKECLECVMDTSGKGGLATLEDEVIRIVNENRVVVFGKTKCPYCVKAKNLLKELDVEYVDENFDYIPNSGEVAAALQKLTGRKTVPNIFIGGRNVGGCDDLFAIHDKGQLKALLEYTPVTGNTEYRGSVEV